jgi:ubiquitin C-terminal hydrolase
MNIKVTSRVKMASLSAILLTTLLTVFISFDTFGIKSFTPSKTSKTFNGTSLKNSSKLSVLFKPINLISFDRKDSKFLEAADYFNELTEVPGRDSNPVGIVNRGNSCYANSVIQMLFRIQAVRRIVANLEIYHKRAKILDNKSDGVLRGPELESIIEGLSVIEGLNHMFHQLQANNNEPATFMFGKSMQCLPGKFAENFQEDADEYFTFIMATLKDIIPKSQHYHLLLNVSFSGTLKSTKYPFKTEQKQQLDVETRISLPFNGDGNLFNLLDLFIAPETVDLKFDDETPGTLVRSKRLENLPKIITIQLQRLSIDFNSDLDENDHDKDDDKQPKIIRKSDIIDMPDELDLAKYANSKQKTKYRLKMFIVHSGSSTGGHYYAYTLINNSWCTLNDSYVDINEKSDVVKKDQQTGYLYFYEQSN